MATKKPKIETTDSEPAQAVQLPAIIHRTGESLPIRTMEEMATAGALLAQSGMFGIQNAAAGFVVASTCHQQGVSLMEFMRTYNVIENKPAMRADAMLAEYAKRGGKYKIVSRTPDKAEIEMIKDGQSVNFGITWEEAQAEPFVKAKDGGFKKNWRTPRARMQTMWARVVSDGVRVMDPGVNAGLYAPEEVADFDTGRPEPTPISDDEAARRAKVVTAEEVDYSVCPINEAVGFGGVKWDTMETETLDAALECDDDRITERHKACINEVLEQRKESKS